jgi:hypothetical protein
MEVERKATVNQANVPVDHQFKSRTTYKIRNKVTLFSRVYVTTPYYICQIDRACLNFRKTVLFSC